MNVVLSAVHLKLVLVHLGDTLIFFASAKEPIEHACRVRKLLSDAAVTFKPKACRFSANNIDYLGSVVARPGHLEIASHTIGAICKLQTTKSLVEVRSFLGICKLFRKLVPNYSRTVAALI